MFPVGIQMQFFSYEILYLPNLIDYNVEKNAQLFTQIINLLWDLVVSKNSGFAKLIHRQFVS